MTVVRTMLKVRAETNCKASTFYLKRLHLKKKKKTQKRNGKTNKPGFPKQRSEERGGSFYMGRGGWVRAAWGGAHKDFPAAENVTMGVGDHE